MKNLIAITFLFWATMAFAQPVRTTITDDGVNVTISTPVNSRVIPICDFHWTFVDGQLQMWIEGRNELIPGGRLGNFTINGATTQQAKLDALGAISAQCAGGGGSGSTTTSTTLDIIGLGDSYQVNRDNSVGTWTYTVNNRVKAWDATTNTFAVANPGANNITPEDDTTTIRNNITWKFADEYADEHTTDSVRILVRSVGSMGSWRWTPKTSGNGETESSNSMLSDLIAELNSAPSNFNAKVIVTHFGSNDQASNTTYFLDNLKEIYDTLIHHARVDDRAIMLVGSVSTTSTYDGINTCVDSLYYRMKDVGNRNIFGVAYDILSTVDAVHYSNEGIDRIGKNYYSVWKQGIAAGPTPPPANNWITSGSNVYRNSEVWVNSTTQHRTNAALGVYQPSGSGVGDLASFARMESGADGRQQELRVVAGADATTGSYIEHYSETSGSPTAKNRLVFADAAIKLQGPTTTDIASFATTAITFAQALTSSANITTTGSTTITAPFLKALGTINTDRLRITGTTGGGSGTYMGLTFGLNDASNNLAAIRASIEGSNGELHFYTTNLSTYTERMRITPIGIGIGLTTGIAARLHLAAGTSAASTAPLKFTSGANLTTPEAGAIEYDGSNWFMTNSTAVRGRLQVNRSLVSSAGTLTLASTYSHYVFTGTTTTWTLPTVSGNTDVKWHIKNRGSGDITINTAAAGNDIYSSSAVNTYTVTPGTAIILFNDGTYFNVE